MKVIVNGNEFLKKYIGFNIQDILDKNETKTEVINKIIVNGTEVNKEFLLNSNLNREDIDCLEIKTIKIADLVLNTLEEIMEYLPKLIEGCNMAVGFYQNNNYENANNMFIKIIDGINWYSSNFRRIINLNNSELTKDYTDYFQSLSLILNELLKSQENEDFILLSDVLEYELIPFLKETISILNSIHDKLKK